jgi:tol-pal system protein YbgF
MSIFRLCLIALLLSPLGAFAQKQQIQELQRDMALMQDEIRGMNERITNLTVMMEQLMDKVNNTNTTVTVLDSSIKDSLKNQEQQIAEPIARVGSKVDNMSNEFRFVKESIADLNSRVGKVQTQITDLRDGLQVMAAPPPPPAGAIAPSGGMAAATPPAAAGGAPMGSAESLYNNARRDQSGGKHDLALMQYQDFLKFYPNSSLAPAAQYGIGEVYFNKADFEAARQAFDLVLEKYPENDRTPDAMFMKAKSLAQANQNRAAAREFRVLVQKYPGTGLAERAQQELAQLGVGQ